MILMMIEMMVEAIQNALNPA